MVPCLRVGDESLTPVPGSQGLPRLSGRTLVPQGTVAPTFGGRLGTGVDLVVGREGPFPETGPNES